MTTTVTVKEQARRLLAGLPDGVTWDDLIYHFYVKQKLEKGQEDVKSGNVFTPEQVRSGIFGE